MSSLPDARRFTVAEYLKLGDAGILRPEERVELVDGVIVAMSPQGPAHSAVVAQILPRLLDWFPRDRYCVRPQSTLPLLDDFSPEPDLAVVEGRCEEHQAAYPTKVALIVEVADTSARLDRGRKAELYAAAGVPEYWVVSIAEGVVEVHREPGASGYALIRRLTAGDALLPSALEALGGAPLPAADLLPR
jgi:Uma2 family endonuclease